MKVFLDDVRHAPAGWRRVRWPDEAIALLRRGDVTDISLDHDLGDDARGTGMDVVNWIEREVALRGFKPPNILIHTANPSARLRMEQGVRQIRKLSGTD